MRKPRGPISVYTVVFLDVIGAIFATILLVYVLLLIRVGREEEKQRQGSYVVLAVRVTALDADGEVIVEGSEVTPRIGLHVPPPKHAPQNPEAASKEGLSGWAFYTLPYDADMLTQDTKPPVCSEVLAHSTRDLGYCMLRGIKPDSCLLELTFRIVDNPRKIHAIQLEGWVATPAAGKQPLSKAVVGHLTSPYHLDAANSKFIVVKQSDELNLSEAVIVLWAQTKAVDEPPGGE